MNCRPLYSSQSRYDGWLQQDVLLGDRFLQERWDEVPTGGFEEALRHHDHRVPIERMVAVYKLYWETGSATDAKGALMYKRY
ncbi:hypothetical protein PG991_005544 [Apiospora marii]|uniref:Uncharacterized protein n=1 Tax=Apiospora marii TaxID=335849 RepID=A0ABR1S9M0_9PEZI